MRAHLAVLALAAATAAAAAGPALAEGHGVTVQNGTSETIRAIIISPTAGTGDNRLRSTLPPGASGRLTYNTGCQANIRIGFESGRTEDHPNVDICSDPRIVAGTQGVAGPMLSPVAMPSATGPATPASKTNATQSVVVAPRPAVPPWTGKSITKRFGGMD